MKTPAEKASPPPKMPYKHNISAARFRRRDKVKDQYREHADNPAPSFAPVQGS